MMLSEEKATYLFDHVLDGFESSNQGIEMLKEKELIGEAEYTSLLKKNIARLLARVKEFKLAEKITCIFFAGLFMWMQVSNEDLQMRRGKRVRVRRRNENELVTYGD